MKRKWIKKLSLCLAAALACSQIAFVSMAYFDRGDVKVKIGKSSVSMEAGDSETVTVSISPSSDRQLPGCGMPECPQSCGEGCLNPDGECTCAGTTYQTYYVRGEVSSSNTGVATASYNNGVLSIKGVSPGTATITVTASLRQYSSTSDSIEVNVTKKASGQSSTSGSTGGNSSSSGNSHSSVGSSSAENNGTGSSVNSGNQTQNNSISANEESGSSKNSSKVGVTSVENSDSSDNTQAGNEQSDDPNDTETSSQNDERSVINSDRGKITFIPIVNGKMGKTDFESIKGKKEYIDFQMKDKNGTVLYAWEFLGTDIKEPADIDMSIETGKEPFDGMKVTGGDSLYLSFGHNGTLPGKASIFLRVTDTFSDEESLNLYYYNEEDQSVSLVTNDLKPESGYVTFSLSHCSDYILTTENLEGATTVPDDRSVSEPENTNQISAEQRQGFKPWIVVVIVIAVAAAGGAVWITKKKRNKED